MHNKWVLSKDHKQNSNQGYSLNKQIDHPWIFKIFKIHYCGTKIIISQIPYLTDGYEQNKGRTSQQWKRWKYYICVKSTSDKMHSDLLRMYLILLITITRVWFSLISQNHKTASSGFLWGKKKQNQRTALSGWFHKPQGPCGFHERTNEQQFCGWLFEFFKFLENHD